MSNECGFCFDLKNWNLKCKYADVCEMKSNEHQTQEEKRINKKKNSLMNPKT